MGFFLRKAFRFGPFRFNLSKSGVGTSTGFTGLRVGTRPDGQSYVHAGRKGLYFREEIAHSTEKATTNNQVTSLEPASVSTSSMVDWCRYAEDFTRYVVATIDQLAEPFTAGRAMMGPEWPRAIPERALLNSSVMSVCWKFAAGAPVSDATAALIRAMRRSLEESTYSTAEEHATPADLRKVYVQSIAKSYSALTAMAASLGGVVVPIEVYDEKQGTEYGSQARTLLFQVAEVTTRTGGVPVRQAESLADFRRYLENMILPPPEV